MSAENTKCEANEIFLRSAIEDLARRAPKLGESEILKALEQIQTINNPVRQHSLTDGDTRINGILVEEPPPAEEILTYNGQAVLTRGIVGGVMAAGGTGKSFLLLQLANVLADGTGLGPLKAAKEFKVLFIAGEDPQEEIERRLWKIGHGDFPLGLHVASVMGRVGPLMQLQDRNPVLSYWFGWLRQTIQSHNGLDVLIIDPKSRFYGLDENSNDHATQWIAALESLSEEFNITILFSHHVSKQRSDSMNQHMSRGASAIVDGCRWVAGMTRLSEDSAKRYDISDHRAYVEFDVTKSNYAAQLPAKFIFKRTENGLLEYAALESDRRSGIKKLLHEELMVHSGEFSRRDLIRKNKGCDVILEKIEADFPTFRRSSELNGFLDELIKNELIEEKTGPYDGRGKPKNLIYGIPFDPMNFRQARL